jgi:hypothetical protein
MILDVVSMQMMKEPENDPLGTPRPQIGQNEKDARFHLGLRPFAKQHLQNPLKSLSRNNSPLPWWEGIKGRGKHIIVSPEPPRA